MSNSVLGKVLDALTVQPMAQQPPVKFCRQHGVETALPVGRL